MSLFQELKERRLVQIVVSYAAAGWIGMSVVSQLVEMSVMPAIVYRVVLVLYLGGLFAASIIGWYHGEKGHQEWTRPQIVMLSFVAIFTLVGSLYVVSRERGEARQARLIEESELDLRRIGVLFLADRSRDEDRTYLAEGITTGLIDRLAMVRDLDVLSANASDQVRDMDVAYDSIARILGAGVLVDGSIQQAGNNVRLNVVIIDGSSGGDLGEISIEKPAEDLLGLQDALIDELADRLRGILGTEVRLADSRASTSSSQAWTSLQRGERAWADARAAFMEGDDAAMEAGLLRADSFFVEASEQDPDWATPWVSRAKAVRSAARVAISQDPAAAREAVDQGLGFAEEALARDPRNAEALEVRGLLKYYMWDFGFLVDPTEAQATFDSSVEDLTRAVDLDPGLASAWSQLSIMYSQQANNVEANQAARRAYEEDQFLASAPQVLFSLYTTSYDLELFPQAMEYCDEAHRRFPDVPQFTECRLWLMATRALPDDVDAAWATLEEFLELVPPQNQPFERAKGEAVVAMVIARSANQDAAGQDPILADSARAVARSAQPGPDVDPTQELRSLEALTYLELGDTDEAMSILRAYLTANPEHREGWRWTAHWWWRDLQDDPGFRSLVGR